MKQFLLIAALLMATISSFAHTWEIRVNQNQDGSLTWYVQSYHTLAETACLTQANQSGLVINGITYPIQSVHSGNIALLSNTVFGVNTSCGTARNIYGIINTPFLGTTLNVQPYSNVACWANCNISANGNFTPPPPPVCTSCPLTGWSNTVAASGNNNGTSCYPNDDRTTATVKINHLSCASITGDKQFRVVFDPSGANISYGPFNYSAGVQTDVIINIPYGTSNSTQVKVIDDDFPCQITHGLTLTGGQYLGERERIAPSISCPGAQTICSNILPDYTGSATVSDNCTATANIIVTQTPAAGSIVSGVVSVMLTAKDEAGNFSFCNFSVSTGDNQFPVLIGVPADATVECNAVPSAPVVTATDNCTTSVPSFTESRVNGNCPSNYTLIRTWSTTDGAGNTTTANQYITVQDTQAPILSAAPANATVECNAVPAAATLTASDNCDNTPVVAYNETRTNGNCPSNYTLTRTWTATDACGNVSSKSQTITVQDTQAPVLSAAPASVTVECNAVPSAATLTASDNCDNAPVVAYNETRTNGNCPSNYTLTRTWTATDACGNVSSKSQTITVQDTQAPVLSAAPASVTVECNAVPAAATLTASDNCDNTPVVAYNETRTNGNCPSNYTLTRTWTATDACGNVSSKSQTITVQDTKAPVLSAAPVNATVSCSAIPTEATLTATDNCDASPVVTYNEASTQNASLSSVAHYNYTLTRTWTATDACGNASNKTQTITVQDVTAPTAVCKPVTITLVEGSASITTTQINNGSSDNCGPVSLSLSKTNFTCANLGANTVTLTVTDVTGNSSTCTATVNVIGEIPTCSIVSVPNSTVFTGGVSTNLYLGYGATATTLQVSTPASGAPYTYSWTGTGLSNTNTSNPVFTPTVSGTYTFTVQATNKYGCKTTCSISICVTDIRVPGTDGKKVYVCHIPPGNPGNANTLSISVNAVPAHVGQHGGDRLGTCTMQACGTALKAINPAITLTETILMEVLVAPNPSTTYFELVVKTKTKETLSIRIMDVNGKLIEERKSVQPNSYIIVGGSYTSGIYFAQITQGETKKVIRLVKGF